MKLLCTHGKGAGITTIKCMVNQYHESIFVIENIIDIIGHVFGLVTI